MLTYHESTWAAKRWDWFNRGRTKEPLSFCQFWRTVLVWATLRWLFSPIRWLDDHVPQMPIPQFLLRKGRVLCALDWLFASFCWVFTLLFKCCWFLLRRAGLMLGRLALVGLKPVGRRTLAGIVAVGEPVNSYINRYTERHDKELKMASNVMLWLIIAGMLAFWLVVFLLADWLLTLIILSSVAVGAFIGGFTLYGIAKSGILGLLWQAALATHHGICPPMLILRGSEAESHDTMDWLGR